MKKLIIVSGRSGSGKSICLHVLEDLGFYCIDNLPVNLLPALIKELSANHKLAAVSIDARNLPRDLTHFSQIFKVIKNSEFRCETLFFDAQDFTLLKRFSETRRKHPLTSDTVSLQEALKEELYLLQPIAEVADLRIDTTRTTIPQLRELLLQHIGHRKNQTLSILFESFGYKFGIPTDADYVFDVRCIPNPYWEPVLRSSDGLNENVAKFLEAQPQTAQLLNDIQQFLDTWIPKFISDNRNYMTIALGCTGGQHRSVYLAEKIAQHFQKKYQNIQIRHREL